MAPSTQTVRNGPSHLDGAGDNCRLDTHFVAILHQRTSDHRTRLNRQSDQPRLRSVCEGLSKAIDMRMRFTASFT